MEFLILHDAEQGDGPRNNGKEQTTRFTQEQFQTFLIAYFASVDYNNCWNKCPPAGPGAAHNSRYRQQSLQCHHSHHLCGFFLWSQYIKYTEM